MATPKIKLYPLFPGYSSQNDNDIQAATNDQLLPVTLKNIMPTNAYTLVGVGKKQQQALIPVLNIPLQSLIQCEGRTAGTFAVPQNVGNKFLVVNKKNLAPIFYQRIVSNTSPTGYDIVDYNMGVDYIYVKDLQSQDSSNNAPNVKFKFYYDQESNEWIVKFVSTDNVPEYLYVRNIFQMVAKEKIVTELSVANAQSIYYLSKSNDNTHQTATSNHQFIPLIGNTISYHLRPTISFTITAEEAMTEQQLNAYITDGGYANDIQTVYLNQYNKCFYIGQCYVDSTGTTQWVTKDCGFNLSQINNNNIKVYFGANQYSVPSGIVYQKTCTLVYYTIPTFYELSSSSLSSQFNSTLINADNLMFMSQQQDLYSGTKNATKPNTLYLQYVKSAKMESGQDANYTIQTNSLTKTTNPKLYSYNDYCRGIIPKSETSQFLAVDNIDCKFRYVYNYTIDKTYIDEKYTQKKGIQFPDSQYLLDTEKGMFYFRKYHISENATNGSYIKTQFDNDFINGNDYFFATYYYRKQITKTFVSDYQSWVTEHLRNNPDIFYGKMDYPGDDYIDANENSIKVGYIPQFLQGGYSISFRNGAVTFASDTQDLDYKGSGDQTKRSTDKTTGVVKGGVARANFAYYNGLQNVLDQKLQWDKSYTGGGYKYRAIKDKQYPDSIGKRWVKRQNTLQFIGASFVTQKLNDQGQLTTYNLPDLQTVQLQVLNKYGFAKPTIHNGYQNTAKIWLDYYITTNNFSYPFVFKISNFKRISSVNATIKNVTSMPYDLAKIRHPNIIGKDITTIFDTEPLHFESNTIYFYTLQNELLQQIQVDFCQVYILPAINVTVPVLTEKITTNIVQINKNSQFVYSGFKFYCEGEYEDVANITDDQTSPCIYIQIPPDKYENKQLYLSYNVSTKLYRSKDTYNETIQTTMNVYQNDNQNNDLQPDYVDNQTQAITSLGKNYKILKNNNSEIIFSISNVNQTTYFKLSVIDFYSVQNTYDSTIVYTVKKYDL